MIFQIDSAEKRFQLKLRLLTLYVLYMCLSNGINWSLVYSKDVKNDSWFIYPPGFSLKTYS
jgi:hypothetical protein